MLYKGQIDLKWIQEILSNRDDITLNVYLYNQNFKINDKRINVNIIPKKINTYGRAYNYIMSKVHAKYFMLLDNLDYLNPDLFNKTITKELLENNYQMIKSNSFYIEDSDNKKEKNVDDYVGTNSEIENKIINRNIFPYFFGCRIYLTIFIKKNKIKFNDTNMYNDVYPNILLARNLDMNKVFICNSLFYTRYRLKWKMKK